MATTEQTTYDQTEIPNTTIVDDTTTDPTTIAVTTVITDEPVTRIKEHVKVADEDIDATIDVMSAPKPEEVESNRRVSVLETTTEADASSTETKTTLVPTSSTFPTSIAS